MAGSYQHDNKHLGIHIKTGNFLGSWATINFPKKDYTSHLISRNVNK